MKKKIVIIGHEDRTSKSGKDYTSFQTSEGQASCFETDVIKKLKKAEKEGKEAIVEIKESKGFLNIRKFYGFADTEKSSKPANVNKNPIPKGKDKQINKAVALKASVSLVSGVLESKDVENAEFWEMASQAVIAMGNRFEKWLNGEDLNEKEG